MSKKKYKQNNVFSDMGKMGVGLAGVSMSTAVGAGVQAQMPAGSPNMMQGFSTLGSMSGVAITAGMGSSILKSMKKKKGGY